ncbi:MAG: hypothetical protein WAL45_09020 [Terracidiphilus sp.]
MKEMTGRELGFLLVGSGTGLVLTAVMLIEAIVQFHHMFIVGFQWKPGSVLLFLPFLLILTGAYLIYRSRSGRKSN